jgi:hypothetical protein
MGFEYTQQVCIKMRINISIPKTMWKKMKVEAKAKSLSISALLRMSFLKGKGEI